MSFCHQCGAEAPAAARFCDQCGAALTPTTSATPATNPPAPPTAAGASTCPQCGMPVIPGEAFCDNCGAPLLGPTAAGSGSSTPSMPSPGGVLPQPTYPAPQPVGGPAAAPTAPPRPKHLPPLPPDTAPIHPAPLPPAPARTSFAGMQLVVQSSGSAVALPAQSEAFVGRGDPVSNYQPDLDLTPHGALEQGVGRRHLRLFVQHGQVLAEDLDSTNGTFLNGQKLSPRSPQSLNAGDELRLGRLTLRVQM